MNSDSHKELLSVHLAVLLFGIAGLFGKWILLPATIIVLGRVVFASISLVGFLKLKNEAILVSKKDLLTFIGLGLLLAIHWVTFFQSIQIASVAIGLLSFSTFPIFTTFLEPLWFKEKLHWKDILIALITFLGIGLIVEDFDLENSNTLGVLVGIISGFTFALISLLNRKLVGNYSSRQVALHQDIWAAVFLVPFLLIEDYSFNWNNLGLLLILGIIFTALAHSLFIEGLKKVKTQTASIIACLEPVYGIIFAFLFLSEMPNSMEILGGVIILSMALLKTIKTN